MNRYATRTQINLAWTQPIDERNTRMLTCVWGTPLKNDARQELLDALEYSRQMVERGEAIKAVVWHHNVEVTNDC